MATWHQKRNPVQLWHETMWTVVSDPPNDCMGLTVCGTEETAVRYLNNLKKRGKGEHCYILPPGGEA